MTVSESVFEKGKMKVEREAYPVEITGTTAKGTWIGSSTQASGRQLDMTMMRRKAITSTTYGAHLRRSLFSAY